MRSKTENEHRIRQVDVVGLLYGGVYVYVTIL